jgi:hypothetical protein
VPSTSLARSGTGPCSTGPASLPSPFIAAIVGSVAAAAFPAGSTLLRPSRLDPPPFWPDRRLHGWIRRCCGLPGRIHRYPFYSAAGTDTLTGAVACAVVGLPGGAPYAWTIEEARRSACRCSFVVSPCRSLTLERRPLPKIRLLLRVFRPRPPRLRLPRHLGAIVFLEHTPVSTPAATFTPSRRCDCGGISTRRLLPSASTPVSSCVVPPLRLRGDVRLCVRECVWAGTTVGLPAH